MCRIGRRLRAGYASIQGVAVEIRPFSHLGTNLRFKDNVWWVV